MVRETGGLKDTVIPYNGKAESDGTGFTFQEYNADAMLEMIRRAKAVFCQDYETWSQIARRGMEANFLGKNQQQSMRIVLSALSDAAECLTGRTISQAES